MQERDELHTAVAAHRAGGYAVDRIVDALCICGSGRFLVLINAEAGVAVRVCASCEREVGIADSDDHFDDVDEVATVECPNGHDIFSVATGFALTPGGEVRWVSVGLRCEQDGDAGVYVDWKIDYSPSAHLMTHA